MSFITYSQEAELFAGSFGSDHKKSIHLKEAVDRYRLSEKMEIQQLQNDNFDRRIEFCQFMSR